MANTQDSNAASGSLDRLVRPVRCYFCNEPMFYVGAERHVPEVRIEVYASSERTSEFYAHQTCWNKAIGPNDQAQRRRE